MVLVLCLLSGCTMLQLARYRVQDLLNGSPKESTAESAEEEEKEPCGDVVVFNHLKFSDDYAFYWEINEPDRIKVARDEFGEIYVTWEELAPEKVDLTREYTDTETKRYWKYETEEIGLFDCKTIAEGTNLIFDAMFYAAGCLYDLQFSAYPNDGERADEDWFYAWFTDLLEEIRLTEEGAAIQAEMFPDWKPVQADEPEAEPEPEPEPEPTPEPTPGKETINWHDMVSRLNEAGPEDFEAMYDEALAEISEKDLTAEWEIICQAISAYTDYAGNTSLKYTADSFPVRSDSYLSADYPGLPDNTSLYDIVIPLNDNYDTPFIERIYVPGCSVEVRAAIWMASDLEEYGYPDTAPDRQPGDPVRILVANDSDVVIVDGEGSCDLIPEYADDIADDLENLWEGFFGDMEGTSFEDAAMGTPDCRVKIVTDPAEADVILTYTLSYPFAGSYGMTGSLSVYNCIADIYLWQVGTANVLEYEYETIAGNSVSARAGSTRLWMHTPDDFDNELGRDVFAWYPDV